jgi:hypothetical protein
MNHYGQVWLIPQFLYHSMQTVSTYKLNYFLFRQNFEKTFSTCGEVLITIIKSDSKVFQFLSLNFRLATSKSEECDSLHTFRLFHKDSKVMFIILYKYYLLKISKLKNQLAKLIFEI